MLRLDKHIWLCERDLLQSSGSSLRDLGGFLDVRSKIEGMLAAISLKSRSLFKCKVERVPRGANRHRDSRFSIFEFEIIPAISGRILTGALCELKAMKGPGLYKHTERLVSWAALCNL